MSNTVSPRQDSSVKRRRILSDIINTGIQPTESHTRRKSLGFDLVRIDVSQPEPQQQSVEMDRRGTNIPTLRNSERYEKFLNISESLNRKCKVNPSDHNSYIPSSKTLTESTKQTTEKLEAEIQTLDLEIRQATDDLSAIDDEYSHQNMLYRALKTEMVELNNVLRDHEAKFEYILSQTTSKVELKQKELEVNLKEYRTKSESSYSNARFELENELRQVTEFDDTEALSRIELLKEEKIRLQNKLQSQDTVNREQLGELEATLNSKLKQNEIKNSEKIKCAAECVRAKERELESLEMDLAKAREVLQAQQQSEAELEQKIQKQKELIENFDVVKENWQEQLLVVTSKIREQEATEHSWAQKVEEAKEAHQKQKAKFDQYQKTIRSLEHALSRFGSDQRVFVRVPRKSESLKDNHIIGLEFDKIASNSEHSEFSLEWELHAQECLRGVLAGLVFCGSEKTNCLDQIKTALLFLFEGMKTTNDRKYDLCIQSVHADDASLVDLLNRLTSPTINLKNKAFELKSQKMMLGNLGDIDTAFKHINLANKTTIHLFTIVGNAMEGDTNQAKSSLGKGFRSQLCLIDLSQLCLDEQIQYLKRIGKNEKLNLLLRYLSSNCKCITISEIGEGEKEDLREFLEAVYGCKNSL